MSKKRPGPPRGRESRIGFLLAGNLCARRLPYSRLHAGSRRSAAARQRSGGSTDAALLEIEEVLGMRYCDPSQMTAVALNPVDEDDERLEYLVSGRFGSGPDDRGFHSVAWVFDGDLLDHVDAEEVKSAMQAYKNRMDKEFAALADACDADM